MKTRLVLIFMAVMLAVTGCSNDDKKTGKGAGKTILKKPPYAGITDSIAEFPDDPALYFERANLLSQAGEYALADADLSAAWKLSPSEGLGESRVNLLFMMGKQEEAIKLLEGLMQTYPLNSRLTRRMGEIMVQSRKYTDVLKLYDTLLAQDSLDFEILYERSLLLLEKKDTLLALRDMEKAYRIQPLQLTALSLANLYAESGNPRSVALTDKVIAADSAGEMIDPYFIKGVYYSNTGNYTKALDLFNQCIRMDWKFQQAYIEKGIIYFDQKNLDEALNQFKLAARVTNSFPDAYYWQGRCYEKLNMEEEALANYARAYALDKSFTEAVEGAARVKAKKEAR